jgi:DNA-binding Lrp family transcriptional regulator
MIKLDLRDRKILALLDENSRYSNAQIAKKVRLSKPAIEYRIQRLQNNKCIFEFYTVVDFTRLGYSQYKIYFKFQDAGIDEEKEITQFWINSKNSVWVAQIRGRWDLAVSILSKSNYDFGKLLSSFMNKYSKYILDKDVLLTEYSPVYAREYLTETKNSEFVYGIPSRIHTLDNTDQILIKALATNARISIVDLAQKTKLTRDVINYRLKKLVGEKIITQYRCYPNLQNIGVNLYKLIIRTKNLGEQSEKQLNQYIKQHKKATQLLKLIGSWDCEIELETENEDELYRILTEIRKEFSHIIRDFDIIRITETYKYDYYPF